jgi:hypothetical protein
MGVGYKSKVQLEWLSQKKKKKKKEKKNRNRF